MEVWVGDKVGKMMTPDLMLYQALCIDLPNRPEVFWVAGCLSLAARWCPSGARV